MKEYMPKSAHYDEQGHLLFAGVHVQKLAEKYGTPLFVYDIEVIRGAVRSFKQAFLDQKMAHHITYASKAFSCLAIYQIMEEEGIGCDVVSAGELYTALQAGMSPENIVFHGNNKLPDELEMALEHHVGTIVIDNFYEIELLEKLLKQKHIRQKILLRIAPGVDAHTHEYILTGHEKTKFGFDLLSGQADEALQRVLACDWFDVRGIHCHIGSQIFSTEGFEQAVRKMFDLIVRWRDEFAFTIDVLNLGGGFGVHYTAEDAPLPIHSYLETLCTAVREQCQQYLLPIPEIWVEPGRSLVAEAGITVYTIGAQKHIPEVCSFISVDGGMTDNIRPALYQADYTGVLETRQKEQASMKKATISGKFCESGDVLIREWAMPEDVRSGELFVVFSTGAYGYAMASNYNRSLRPAVVFVEDKQDQLVIRRESLTDLLKNDLFYH